MLLRRWSKAKTGEGQVVLLSGEAGIGKSRLTAALLEHLATEPHTRLRYFCSPQRTDSALYPIIARSSGPLASRTTTPLKQSSTKCGRCSQPFPKRPRGMHQRTYMRLQARDLLLLKASVGAAHKRLSR